ncbi:hypothetical protein Tco_0671808 [Tanacetum coccineum]
MGYSYFNCFLGNTLSLPCVDHPVPEVSSPVSVVSTGSPSLTSVDQDASTITRLHIILLISTTVGGSVLKGLRRTKAQRAYGALRRDADEGVGS